MLRVSAGCSAALLQAHLPGRRRPDASSRNRSDIRASSTLERIGLQDGDVVLAIGDNRIENGEQVVPALRSLDLSTNIEIEIERGGVLQTVEVPAGTL